MGWNTLLVLPENADTLLVKAQINRWKYSGEKNGLFLVLVFVLYLLSWENLLLGKEWYWWGKKNHLIHQHVGTNKQ